MKLFSIVALLLFVGGGCVAQKPEPETDSFLAAIDSGMEDIDRGIHPDKINKAIKSEINKSEDANSMNDEETNVDSTRALPPHEDLAATYSLAVIKTSLGDITVAFYADKSPITVNNFMNLAQDNFYDGTKFHRVIEDFMIQGGDPLSKDDDNTRAWGTGGPDYRFGDEFNDEKIVRGSLAMANSGPATNGSQFFIVTTAATPHLDGKHTNFGYVVEGLDVIDKIEGTETGPGDRPVEPISILSVELVAPTQ